MIRCSPAGPKSNRESARRRLAAVAASVRRGRRWQLPVCYGDQIAACGPDLERLAEACGLTPAEVIRLHSSATYEVYMLGFLPGFPFMGDLPEVLARRGAASRGLRVPAGSVATAGTLTAIYPWESPGGWHLIGACPCRCFRPAWPQAALLLPGDRVSWRAIDAAEYQALSDEKAALRASRAAATGLSARWRGRDERRPGSRQPGRDGVDPGSRPAGSAPARRAARRRARARLAAAGQCPAGQCRRCAGDRIPRRRSGVRARESPVQIALAGHFSAVLTARMGSAALPSWRSVTLAPGETLRCGMLSAGRVGYVALAGICVPQQLGSASTYARAGLGGLDGRLLTPAAAGCRSRPRAAMARRGCGPHRRLMPAAIRVVLGPQADYFDAGSIARLPERALPGSRRRRPHGHAP
jgi:KipI family sensor histidine kinase inhibitor